MVDIIRTLLVPTDFSKYAEAAVDTAAIFARKLQAKLILLHVVDIPGYGGFQLEDDLASTSLEEIATNAATERLNRLRNSSKFKGINLEIRHSVGKVHSMILAECQNAHADLIIMGTHGLTGIDRLLLGSNTKKVVKLSDTPVLTLKESLNIKDVKNVAFASNFNQEYSISFPKIYQFMDLFKAKMHFLKVITPSDFETTAHSTKTIKDFADDFLVKDNYQVQIVNAFTVEEGLDWFCHEYHIDLLFMATHGRRGLAHLLFGSHTERMGQQHSFPVCSIKMVKAKTPRGVIFPD